MTTDYTAAIPDQYVGTFRHSDSRLASWVVTEIGEVLTDDGTESKQYDFDAAMRMIDSRNWRRVREGGAT